MAKIDLHFYHGFLGCSNDWDPVLDHLSCDDYQIWRNDLPKTFSQNFKNMPEDTNYLERWGQCEELLWGEQHNKRILVGYSLGGRLMMHIDPSKYDAALFISSHPGLPVNQGERLKADEELSEKMLKQNWSDFMKDWNASPVFAKDRLRPDRSSQEKFHKEWSLILSACSLGRQSGKDSFFYENKDKLFWAYGESDLVYSSQKKRMNDLLGEDHVFAIPGSGHGVIFDSPKKVAEIVEKVVESVG